MHMFSFLTRNREHRLDFPPPTYRTLPRTHYEENFLDLLQKVHTLPKLIQTVWWERYRACSPTPLWRSSVRHDHSHPPVSPVRSGLHLLLVSISCSYTLLHETRADPDLVWDSEVLLHQQNLEITSDRCLILRPSIVQKGGSQSVS